VAATVNNRPVWRWDLENRLIARFGSQTIDELVSESLIKQAAAKNNVTVGKTEIDNKVSEIEKSLAGKITLKDALAQQGMTVDDFRRQVELQLTLEKLTASSVVVSDKEVADYIDKNRATLTATDEAGMKDEARKILAAGKQGTVLRDYFTNLRSQAKIIKYL
ncbi:SurA N-terminal domain-containing protein, partial [Candidatus Gottesmanbacteria bacterium]|nr:SurA N-terminal domain-containing protein [Candidatus Gottesmanbacteria bacterium]